MKVLSNQVLPILIQFLVDVVYYTAWGWFCLFSLLVSWESSSKGFLFVREKKQMQVWSAHCRTKPKASSMDEAEQAVNIFLGTCTTTVNCHCSTSPTLKFTCVLMTSNTTLKIKVFDYAVFVIYVQTQWHNKIYMRNCQLPNLEAISPNLIPAKCSRYMAFLIHTYQKMGNLVNNYWN